MTDCNHNYIYYNILDRYICRNCGNAEIYTSSFLIKECAIIKHYKNIGIDDTHIINCCRDIYREIYSEAKYNLVKGTIIRISILYLVLQYLYKTNEFNNRFSLNLILNK